MPGGQILKTRWKIRESSKNSDLYLFAVGMRKVDIFTCPGVIIRKLDGKLEKVLKIQYCRSTEISGICRYENVPKLWGLG